MFDLVLGGEALRLLVERFPFRTVLDIGAGAGLHTKPLRSLGKQVTAISWSAHPDFADDIIGDYNETEFAEKFDVVWASHVLEHQLNVNLFLRKTFRDLKPGGTLAISVPPLKHQIVGGHVTLWNAGLLLYNLVMAGFDCRNAAVRSYGYNISVLVRKRLAVLPADLSMDMGDLEKLSAYFPFEAKQDFDGQIQEIAWSERPVDERPVAGPAFDAITLSINKFRTIACPFPTDVDSMLWALECREITGAVAEFGVFKGGSITAIANACPGETVWGFDSFEGLPEPWVRSDVSTYGTGHFALPELPPVPANVRLVKGFFDVTAPLWRDQQRGPISFLHIDSDLYSSAIEVLTILNDRIVAGTVIVFDELCDWKESDVYPAWPEGEWKALLEWMSRFSRSVRPLARGPNWSGSIVVAQ